MKADRIRRELIAQGFHAEMRRGLVVVSIYESKALQEKWPKPCAEAVMGPLKAFCERNDLIYKRIGGRVTVRGRDEV